MDLYDAFLAGDVAEDDIQKIDCKCPKCGIVHQKRMTWTGRGMPRKYCNKCKGYSSRFKCNVRDIDWE